MSYCRHLWAEEYENMSLFDGYQGDLEKENLPIVKAKELVNKPFEIVRITVKYNVQGDYGPRNIAQTVLMDQETDTKVICFVENKVLFSKLEFLSQKGGYQGVPLTIRSKNAGNGNSYYDIEEI